MKCKKICNSLLASVVLSGLFLGQSSDVDASDISNVQGVNGVYNINAEKINGHTGFRYYDKFNLSNGDIANLQFKKGTQEFQHFVNMVNNQIHIDGIVNTMKGNSFYNGHAIFVSPNGMVVGASGVLNVGSLSVLTPTKDKFDKFYKDYSTATDLSQYIYNSDNYKGLITDSQGEIVINGKIIAREEVNLYGSDIDISKDDTALTNNTPGIIAGYKGNKQTFDLNAAEELFNKLVSNNIANANSMELDEKGKISLVANKVVGSLETPDTEIDDDDLSEEVTAQINLEDAVLGGYDVNISASASHLINTTIDNVPSALKIISILDPLSLIGATVNENFDGTRASATIDLDETKIYSFNNTSLSTNANASFILSTPDGKNASKYIYALGSETTSEINISSSSINAENSFIANSFSQNMTNLTLSNSLLFKTKDTPPKNDGSEQGGEEENKSKQFLLVNQSTISDTSTDIDESDITAQNVSINAINSSSDKINIKTTANTKEKTGIAITSLVKNQKIDTSAKVEDDSNINLKGGNDKNLNIITQNLSVADNTVNMKINDYVAPQPTEVTGDDAKKINKNIEGLQKQMAKASSDGASSKNDGANVIDIIRDLLSTSNENPEPKPSYAQIGGTLIVNKGVIDTNSEINESTVSNAGMTNVISNAVDLTVNNTSTTAKGNTTFGAGLAIVVDSKDKNTLANILNDSVINSDGVFVNATTELPMNVGELKLTLKIPGLGTLTILDIAIDSSGDDNWNFNDLNTWETPEKSTDTPPSDSDANYKATNDDNSTRAELSSDKAKADKDTNKPEFSFERFFNNFAKSSADSDKGAVSGSFVYNSTKNNTNSVIQNSTINASTGNVKLNAVNSVISYNASGAIDYIFNYITEETGGETEAVTPAKGLAAIGGAVMVNVFDNNAKSIIDNSNVTASNSDIIVNSSNEQAYISSALMGSKGTKAAIDGSVIVQTLKGETTAKVINTSKLQGNNISVIAGEGEIATAKKVKNVPVIDDETGQIKINPSRKSNDKVSNVMISGALAQQSGTSGAASTGVAVGASVNVNNIKRNLNAIVENSDVTAKNSAKVDAKTNFQAVDVAIAGGFAGGVSTDKTKQENANNGETSKDKTNGAQKFGNFGGWIDKLNKIAGKSSTFDNEANSPDNVNDTKNATEKNILEQLSDKTTQDALKSTNSKVVTETVDVLDENGNPVRDSENNKITKEVAVIYKPDKNGVYRNSDGVSLKDKNGHDVVIESGTSNTDLTNELAKSSQPSDANLLMANADAPKPLTSNPSDSSISKSNFSLAAAGAVNVHTNTSEIKSEISNSTIVIGSELEVNSKAQSQIVDVASGITKAGTVGAGAAVNVNNFKEKLSSTIKDNTEIDKFGDNNYNLKVNADDYNKAIDVSLGIGIASAPSGAKVALGGSFNVDVADSEVVAKSINSNVSNAKNVEFVANNYIDAYKGAGDLRITRGSSATGVGAGIASNINILSVKTNSEVNSSTIEADNVYVLANNKDKRNNNILSAAIGGAVLTGGSSFDFSLCGSSGTDILTNNISAQVLNGTKITSTGDIKVKANSNIRNVNIDNTLTFSTATKGAGIGLGAIVEVIKNTINTKIENSSVLSANSVDISSTLNEDFKFIAVNMGINTGGTWAVDVNGIVNVLKNNINSYITNSNLTSTGNINLESLHTTSISGITVKGSGSTSGSALGNNAVVNVLNNKSNAVSDNKSTISASGDITIKSFYDENLNINAASADASVKGVVALSANVISNVLTNTTIAKLSSNITQSKSVLVDAHDLTDIYERQILAAGTGGIVGIGGAVSVDVMSKTVDAIINSKEITSAGKVSVNADSSNAFGAEKNSDGKYIEKAIGSVQQILAESASGLNYAPSLLKWQFTADGAGASTAGIGGSVIVKNIKNTVTSSIDGTIIKSNGLDVKANDYTITNAIVGNVEGSRIASVGASAFVNVLNATTAAKILKGSDITSSGDINIQATNKEVVRDIIVAAGGATTVAVNGAATVNVITNHADAIIENNVKIQKAKDLNIIASNIFDTQSIDLAGSGAGIANVGGIFKFNQHKANTNVKIGDINLTKTNITGITGSANISANTEEANSAMLSSIGGAGTAAVNGIAIVNIINSKTNALVENSTLQANSGTINLNATHSYNKGNDAISANLLQWMKINTNNNVNVNDFKTKFTPLVSSLNIAGSGIASVTGNITVNTITSEANAKVTKSEVSTKNGLKLNAHQEATTFDATAGVAGAGIASVVVNGVVNVVNDKTKAIIENNTTVSSGGAELSATDKMNLNSAQFSAGGAGVAAVMIANNTNVLTNNIDAYIINSNITGNTKVNAENIVNLNDFYAAVAGAGAAAVYLAPTVNSYVSKAHSYIQNSQLYNGSNEISAKNILNTGNMISGLTFGVVGAAVNGLTVVNSLLNETSAYIIDSSIHNASKTSVLSNTNNNMYAFIASFGVAGTGAAVPIDAIVNVYNSNQNSYILNSSIEKGDVQVEANSSTIASSINGTGAGNIIGAGVGLTALVNVFKNKTYSNLLNSQVSNASNITVKAHSEEIVDNKNIGLGASATAGISANALVNVIENETIASINSLEKSITSNGNLTAEAYDKYLSNNISGVLTLGIGSVGASVDVNTVNNIVKAQILSSTGSINVGSADIKSNSIIGMSSSLNSLAVGVGGIAGNVTVTTIGGKLNLNDIDQNNLKNQVQTALDSANTTLSKIGIKVTTSSDNDRGVKSSVTANLTAKNNINIAAENKLQGYSGDTYTSTNRSIAGGIGTIPVGVQVANMKYKTTAEILGGNVKSEAGSININATSNLKSSTDILATNVSAIGINGAVAYFTNTAQTKALINSLSDGVAVSAFDRINVNSVTNNSIFAKAISAGLSGIAVGINIAVSKDNATTLSKITGNNVNIASKNIDLGMSIASSVESELNASTISAINVNTVVNRSHQNTIAQALIDATGNIKVDNLNIYSLNKGLYSKDNYYTGSITLGSVIVDLQGAYIDSQFTTGINSSNINIFGKSGDFAENINIFSGVLNTGSNPEAGIAESNLYTKAGSVSLVNGQGVNKEAKTNLTSNTNIKTGSGSIKTKKMLVNSSLKRNANINQTDSLISALSINVLDLKSNITGNNYIEFNGNNIISDTAKIYLNDSSFADTELIRGNISLINGGGANLYSNVNTNSLVDLQGKIANGKIEVKSNVERLSYVSASTSGGGLVAVNVLNLDALDNGNSLINISAINPNNTYANNLDIKSNITNAVQNDMSSKDVAIIGIFKNGGRSKNSITTTNNINIENANISSSGDVIFDILTNNCTIRKMDTLSAGIIVASANTLQDATNTTTSLNIKNSNISAKNVTLTSGNKFGDENYAETSYSGKNYGFIGSNSTCVKNDIKQTSNINLVGTKINAINNFTANVKNNSAYKQKVSVDARGFVGSGSPHSEIFVTNYNNFTNDANSVINADNVYINMDSSNNLKSEATCEVRGFSGSVGSKPSAIINVTTNNNITNNGLINSNILTQLDYMGHSNSNLNQYTYLDVDAAMPFGDIGGYITRNINNKLNIPANASIISGESVIGNFNVGQETLTSLSKSKQIMRIIFGIPIDVSRAPRKIVNKSLNNTMSFNGTIIAGSGNQKYLKIGRTGEILEKQGFKSTDITKLESGKISGDEWKANLLNQLNNQKAEYISEVQELEQTKASNDVIISAADKVVTKTQNELTFINSHDAVTPQDIINNIAASVIGTGEGQITPEQAQKLMDDFQKTKKTSLEDFIAFISEQTTLTDAAKINIISTVTIEVSKITVDPTYQYGLYEDKIIYTSLDEKQVILNNLKAHNQAAINEKNYYTNQNQNITGEIQYINDCITYTNNLIAEVKEYHFDDIVISKGTFVFDNINSAVGGINLNNLPNTNITGNDGIFYIPDTGILVENYSSYDLLFKNIVAESENYFGLMINQKNYNNHANNQAMNVNCYIDPKTKQEVHTGVGPHLKTGLFNETKHYSGITIKNYLDNSNPLIPTELESDIMLAGATSTNSNLLVWNESGNIVVGDYIKSSKSDLYATQGDIIFSNNLLSYKTNLSDIIYAGENVQINAKAFENNGTIIAGNNDRNITITEDMLLESNLIVDPSTGIKNMINLKNTSISPYLEKTNNIKALYIDGQIVLFDTTQKGGSVISEKNIVNNGKIVTTTGYSKLEITNNTKSNLIINELKNNYMKNQSKGIVADTHYQPRTEVASANTIITSNDAQVQIRGQLQNGYKSDTETGAGSLNINADTIAVNNLKPESVQLYTIDTTGEFNMNSKHGTLISGAIINRLGNTKFENTSTIVKESPINNGIIFASTANLVGVGDVILNNTGEKGIILSENSFINSVGKFKLSNTGKDGVLINANITNSGNDEILIHNEGASGTTINGEVRNTAGGNITIENTLGTTRISKLIETLKGAIGITSKDGIKIEANIKTKDGDVIVNNTDTNRIELANNTYINAKGKVNISNKGAGGVLLNGNITNSGNDEILIHNEGASGTTINGEVKNTAGGNITIENTSGRTTISKLIETVKGAIGITSKDGIKIDGNINAKDGDVIVNNTDTSGIELANNTFVYAKGKVNISNKGANGVLIEGNITNSGNDEIIIHNEGASGTTINAEVKNTAGGDITIENTSGRTKISKLIETIKGAIGITSKDGIKIEGNINTADGDVIVNNTDTNGIELANNTSINAKGKVNLSNEGAGGVLINGNIANRGNDGILIHNEGAAGTTITGHVFNNNDGNITINNNLGKAILNGLTNTENGSIAITSKDGIDGAGRILAMAGEITIQNTSSDGILFNENSEIIAGKKLIVTNEGANGIQLNGRITNIGNEEINITNNGTAGTTIGGSVMNIYSGDVILNNNSGKATIKNMFRTDNGDIKITSTNGIESSGGIETQIGNLYIHNTSTDGILFDDRGYTNANGIISIVNDGEKGIVSNSQIFNTGNDTISIINNGSAGMTINARISNINGGYILFDNNAGKTTVNSFIDTIIGDIDVNSTDGIDLASSSYFYTDRGNIALNNTSTDSISVAGHIVANNGNITLNNESLKGGIITEGASEIDSKGLLSFINKGKKGIDINGAVINTGDTDINNNSGLFNLSVKGTGSDDITKGSITNNGNLTIYSRDGVNIAGEIKNKNGQIDIKNASDITQTNSGLVIAQTQIADSVLYGLIENNTKGIENSINLVNFGKKGIVINGGIANLNSGAIIIDNNNTSNTSGIEANLTSSIINEKGDLNIFNSGAKNTYLDGTIGVTNGNVRIINDGTKKSGILIDSNLNMINKKQGDIVLANYGKDDDGNGITIFSSVNTNDGNIFVYNQNSDITFGTYASLAPDDKGFLSAHGNNDTGNVYITLNNGDMINGLNVSGLEPNSYHDKATPDDTYKTDIIADGNLSLNVTDGNIGVITGIVPSIESDNMNYRESINVNVAGTTDINVKNIDKIDEGLVNLRAKESNLNLSNIDVDGDVLLLAPDWRQADNVDPDTDKTYYKGYSILNAADNSDDKFIARNMTLISSNTIGTAKKRINISQISDGELNLEAENNIYSRLSSTDDEANVGNIVSKQGTIEANFEGRTVIDQIGAGGHIKIVQDKGDLFIRTVGVIEELKFNDILEHHDKISSGWGIIPETVDIALNEDDATLTIYNAYVIGDNMGAGAFDKNGNRLADVKLKADNIIVTASDVPSSNVETKKHPDGLKINMPEETDGIVSVGAGNVLAIDITGKNNSINNNAIISVNSTHSRGALFNKLYSNDVYINTKDSNLSISDANIKHYGEIHTGAGDAYDNLTAVIDNDFRRLIGGKDNARSIQLYTEKTGNFYLGLNDTIVMYTNAPVVNYEAHKLSNTYGSENSFVTSGFKETSIQQNYIRDKKDELPNNELDKKYKLTFNTAVDADLVSNVNIYKISKDAVYIINDKSLKIGKVQPVNIKIEAADIDVTVNTKVVRAESGTAELQFIDMPEETANKIMYWYFQKENSQNTNLTHNSKEESL